MKNLPAIDVTRYGPTCRARVRTARNLDGIRAPMLAVSFQCMRKDRRLLCDRVQRRDASVRVPLASRRLPPSAGRVAAICGDSGLTVEDPVQIDGSHWVARVETRSVIQFSEHGRCSFSTRTNTLSAPIGLTRVMSAGCALARGFCIACSEQAAMIATAPAVVATRSPAIATARMKRGKTWRRLPVFQFGP